MNVICIEPSDFLFTKLIAYYILYAVNIKIENLKKVQIFVENYFA